MVKNNSRPESSRYGHDVLSQVETMKERRTHTVDRRQGEQMPKMPFRDSNGDLIVLDRRYLPDRRRVRAVKSAQ
jgi:hypothetical protein